MATYNYVEVQIQEARYLADLIGIKVDLESVIDFCNTLLNICGMERPDFKLTEPLSIAILIKYSRPFAKGVRKRLSIDVVPELTKEELEYHKKFIALRNKHIAHSINEFEENIVKAYYNDERVHIEGITSIAEGHRRLTSIGGDDAEAIIALSNKIIDYVNLEMKAEKAKILEFVRNRPIDEVLRVGSTVFLPKMKNVDKRRKQ
jgi:hypothetical protein